MAVTQKNRQRWRAVLLSRAVKWIFKSSPAQPNFGTGLRAGMRAGLWRVLFVAENGELHRSGEILLADLREFATGAPMFSPEPLIMARRAGRREVFERIINYLNLDEAAVQQLLELDDGLE